MHLCSSLPRAGVIGGLALLFFFVAACPRVAPEQPPAFEAGYLYRTPDFPSRAQIEQLARQHTLPSKTARVADVASWTLAEPEPPILDWSALLTGVVGEAAQVSESARCVAEQLAAFRTEHDAPPPFDLERFMVGACGSTALLVHRQYVVLNVHGEVKADQLRGAALPLVQQAVNALAGAKAPEYGIAARRSGNTLRVAVVAATRTATDLSVERLSGLAHVGFRPEIPVDHVEAWAADAQGASVCQTDSTDGLWHASCPVGDSATSIEVVGFANHSVVPRPLLFVSATNNRTWQRSRAPSAGAWDRLTRRRASAGKSALARADAQSTAIARLLPLLRAATEQGRADLVDQVQLAWLAGYDVDGFVSWAECAWADRLPAQGWEAILLASPRIQAMLVAPERVAVAAAAVPASDPQVGAICVYRLEGEPTPDQVAHVRRAIDAARESAGQAGLAPFPEVRSVLSDTVASVEAGTAAREVIFPATQQIAIPEHLEAHGWHFEARFLEHLEIPESIRTAEDVRAEVALARYRPADRGWMTWVVLVLGVSR